MRLLTSAAMASLLALAPVSCKRTRDGDTSGPKAKKTPRKPGMPKPLRLPAKPDAAVHVANPKLVLTQLAAYSPGDMKPRDLVRQAVGQSTAGFEKKLVEHVGFGRPWSSAVVGGQTIAYIPIRKNSLGAVAALLANLPKEGKFGAVRLQRGPEDKGPKLAYLDKAAATLTLADDLRGISTGPDLAGAYGKKGMFITLGAAQAAKYGLELPAETLTIRGSGIHDFKLSATGVRQDYPQLDKMADGALTGMLESPNVALGFSTKYAHYKNDVNRIIGNASRQVSKQNFLIRGNLEELLKRAKAMMRAWNGRVMVGVGPEKHVLLGVGSDDGKFGVKTLYFISGIVSNLKTARTFGVGGLPRIRFSRSKDKSAGSNIHVVALENARKHVPGEYHALIGERGDLRVCFAFPARMGGAMAAIGPSCQIALKTWLADTANATPGDKSRDHFAAATVAVGPGAVQKVISDQTGAAALGLSANKKPTKFVLKRNEDAVKLAVKGPKSK